MNVHDAVAGGWNWLSVYAMISRVGAPKISGAGNDTATAVASVATARRDRSRSATQRSPVMQTGVASRVNDSTSIVAANTASQGRGRRNARTAVASAAASSATPKLSVRGRSDQ